MTIVTIKTETQIATGAIEAVAKSIHAPGVWPEGGCRKCLTAAEIAIKAYERYRRPAAREEHGLMTDQKSGTPRLDLSRLGKPGWEDYLRSLMGGEDIESKTATEKLRGVRFSVDRSDMRKEPKG